MKSLVKHLIIGASMALFATGVQAHSLSVNNDVEAKGTIYRVIDGDTFQVNIDKNGYQKLFDAADGNRDILKYFNSKYKSIRVRLSGTNTEESTHSDKYRNTKFGKETSNHVKNLVEGKKTSLKCYDFGYYHRAICSMTIYDGGKSFDLGEYLIKNGYSDYYTKYGKSPYYHNTYIKY